MSNVWSLFNKVKSIAKRTILTIAVSWLVGAIVLLSVVERNYLIMPLVDPDSFLIRGAGLAFLVPSPLQLPLLPFADVFADVPIVDQLPTGEGLNDFMKTSYAWGINTGKKFLGLLLAYKLAAALFKK